MKLSCGLRTRTSSTITFLPHTLLPERLVDENVEFGEVEGGANQVLRIKSLLDLRDAVDGKAEVHQVEDENVRLRARRQEERTVHFAKQPVHQSLAAVM